MPSSPFPWSKTRAPETALSIEPDASAERLLDLAIENTFPASDPIAIQDAYAAARRRA